MKLIDENENGETTNKEAKYHYERLADSDILLNAHTDILLRPSSLFTNRHAGEKITMRQVACDEHPNHVSYADFLVYEFPRNN